MYRHGSPYSLCHPRLSLACRARTLVPPPPPPLPPSPVQVLTVNMVTSVTLGLVLALEHPEPDVMTRTPRDPKAPLLDAQLAWRTVYVTVLLVTAMLGNGQWSFTTGASGAEAQTAAMTTLVVAQALYAVSCRYTARCALWPSVWVGNTWLLAMVFVNAALQCFLIYTPGVQGVWRLAPIDGLVWLRVLLLALGVVLVVEAEKQAGPRFIHPLALPAFEWLRVRTPSPRGWLARHLCPVPSSAHGVPAAAAGSSSARLLPTAVLLVADEQPPRPRLQHTAATAQLPAAAAAVEGSAHHCRLEPRRCDRDDGGRGGDASGGVIDGGAAPAESSALQQQQQQQQQPGGDPCGQPAPTSPLSESSLLLVAMGDIARFGGGSKRVMGKDWLCTTGDVDGADAVYAGDERTAQRAVWQPGSDAQSGGGGAEPTPAAAAAAPPPRVEASGQLPMLHAAAAAADSDSAAATAALAWTGASEAAPQETLAATR